MNRKVFAFAAVFLFQLYLSLFAGEIGPNHGSLIVVGGGRNISNAVEKFVELAGGPDAVLVIIPTAGGAQSYDQNWPGTKNFREAGARNITVLHTYDRELANSEEFVKPLQSATGVWFSGGRQWRLADAYLGTRVETELWKLLERGGVIGGTSAGATILGSYLVRGDTKTNTIMMGDHEKGFGFLKNVAIDQHLLRRNRQFDLIEVIEEHPELLGIGIDEDTAIWVHGDEFEVLGPGYVAIYDFHRMIPPVGRFYFLAPGDRFLLKERKAIRPNRGQRYLDRAEPKEWK